MMYRASYHKHTLQFIRPAGTSRGTYLSKESWFLFLSDGEKTGVGECSLLKDLSIDDQPGFEEKLAQICAEINQGSFDFLQPLTDFPAIKFGLETALLDLKHGGQKILFPSMFTEGKNGIHTNGLIWMGDKNSMREQIARKIESGFSCIKLKIGAIDWPTESEIIAEMRRQFSPAELTIRVDANGAYSPQKAREVIAELARLEVHSIEQPIKAGQPEEMAKLCCSSPIAIALDEELIGKNTTRQKIDLLEKINPQFLILKPSLLGGFQASEEWISIAEKMNIGWWATSALESNIGLNAISQWVFTKKPTLPQGLGTGMLYSNNIDSPLTLINDNMYYIPDKKWEAVPPTNESKF